MHITPLRFEHHLHALGIGERAPRLTWRVEGAAGGWAQNAYEIEARDDAGALVWNSGRIASSESVLVPWPGAPLLSRRRLHVSARVWPADGPASAWSEPATVEAGLLEIGDWKGRFITPDWDEDTSIMQPSPLLRREFSVDGGLVRARLYATALGVYEIEINGACASDDVLAPGWSSYAHRLRYQTFDVLPFIREGTNAIGAMLGDGWYRGRIGFPGVDGRNLYGDRLALLAQLELMYADGRVETIVSDPSWRASSGAVRSSGIYEGEAYDARLERDWSSPGFDDASWVATREVEHVLATLVASPGPPVRRQEELAPIEITRSSGGKTIIDFGQNAAGRLRLNVEGDAGTTITLRHAELLQAGELCTEPLRTAQATDRYTRRGGEAETWEPRFTFHGFRYAEVDGYPRDLHADDVRMVVCHSDMERTGWFECSDPLVNRLHENAVWSLKSNFLDVPTDCPQRDERLGWTGDLTVFAPSACFLYDCAGFLSSWLADLAADQGDDGIVPIVVPVLPGRGGESPGINLRMPQAVWGDAAVIVPWTMYERFGDAGILERQYSSMTAWVDAVARLAGPGRLWDKGFQFADWLDPSAPADRPHQAMTDPHLVAAAYFFRIADLLSRAAAVLDRDADRERYRRLADDIRIAFQREYVTPSGRMASDTQTAYALAIVFDLLASPEQRERAGRRLARLVRNNEYRVGTGFAGTAIVADALSLTGEGDAALRMLTERSCPSWLYPVTAGATTIWERWDALKPDGSINSSTMTSFNHYALGAVVDWMHRRVGGLAPLAPGYRRLEVNPLVGGGLTWAEARHRTPYGMARSRWQAHGDGSVEMHITVPSNTQARVVPPDGSQPFEVASGEHSWTFSQGASANA